MEWTTLKSLRKYENKSNADNDNSNKGFDVSKHLRENNDKENTGFSEKK